MKQRLSFRTIFYLIALFTALVSAPTHAQETGPAGSVLRVPSTGGKARMGPLDLNSSNATTNRLNARTKLGNLQPGLCMFGDSSGYLLNWSANDCVWDITNKALGLGGSPDASSALSISSTTKGFLLPRMTSAEKLAIASPAPGLMVYDTTLHRVESFSFATMAWGPVGRLMGSATALDASAAFQVDATTRGSLPAPRMTSAQRDAIPSPATGLQIYNTTTNSLNVYNGTVWSGVGGGGSGDGAKNYIGNGDAENGSTTGWFAYNDGAVTRPLDGSGGTATGINFVNSGTNALDDSKSFVFSKDAANRQGSGYAYDFTVDPSARGKVISIKQNYRVASGTFVPGVNGTTPSDGDLIVYIYDITNGTVLEPSSIKFFGNSTITSDAINTTFQTSINGSSYRLIYHIASTSTNAFSLQFDNIKVQLSTYPTGTPISDWFTLPNAAGTLITGVGGNPTYGTVVENIARGRRVGDSLEFNWTFKNSSAGSPGTGLYLVNIPYAINTALTGTNGSARNQQSVVGTFKAVTGATTAFAGSVHVYNQNQLYVELGQMSSNNTTTAATWNNTSVNFGGTYGISINFTVPIVGWSSSVQMADFGNSTTPVSFVGAVSGSQGVSGNVTNFALAPINDSRGGWNSANNWYVVPEPGVYLIGGSCYHSAITNYAAYIDSGSGGSFLLSSPWVSGIIMPGIGMTPYLKSGQTISIRAGANGSVSSCRWSINKVGDGGTQALAASDPVIAKYTSGSGQTINTTATQLAFENKVLDTHNAFINGNTFRAPAAGKYRVWAKIMTVNTTTINSVDLELRKNTVLYSHLGRGPKETTVSSRIIVSGMDIVQLNEGETIDVRAQSGVGTIALINDGIYVYITIERIGL